MSSPAHLRVELARLVDDPPTTPDRLSSVRRRAARMRRRRATASVSGVAVAGVAAVLAMSTVVTSTSITSPLTRLPTFTPLSATALPTGILLADQQGKVHRLEDLHSGHASTVRNLTVQTGNSLRAAVGTGADGRTIIAFDALSDIIAIDPDHPERSRILLKVQRVAGLAAWYDVPGVGRRTMVRPYLARGGGLWLWAANVADGQPPVRGSSLVPLNLEGHRAGAPIDLPPIQWVAAVGYHGAYVAISAGGNRLRLMRVDASGRLHGVSAEGGPSLDESNYGAALWNGSADCNVDATGEGIIDGCHHEALDAETGRVIRLRGRPSIGYLSEDVEVFSPDGRYAAVWLGGLPLSGNGRSSQGWAVVDLVTQQVTVVKDSIHFAPSVPPDTVTWSGDRLLWTSAAPDGSGTIVGAYLPATHRSVTTRLRISGLRALGAQR